MSAYMLSDENTIDDVNPYVMYDFSLPGTLRKTSDFSDFSEPVKEDTILQDEISPICEYGVTAGDKTANLCKGGSRGVPLDKTIHPKRNIDLGYTGIKNEGILISPSQLEYVIYKNTDLRVFVIGIILTLILLFSIR
jgi:hypothetical protein